MDDMLPGRSFDFADGLASNFGSNDQSSTSLTAPIHHTRNSTHCPVKSTQNASSRKEVPGACRYVCASRPETMGEASNRSLTKLRSPPHVALLHLRYVEQGAKLELEDLEEHEEMEQAAIAVGLGHIW